MTKCCRFIFKQVRERVKQVREWMKKLQATLIKPFYSSVRSPFFSPITFIIGASMWRHCCGDYSGQQVLLSAAEREWVQPHNGLLVVTWLTSCPYLLLWGGLHSLPTKDAVLGSVWRIPFIHQKSCWRKIPLATWGVLCSVTLVEILWLSQVIPLKFILSFLQVL